jgi:antitoxin MazE
MTTQKLKKWGNSIALRIPAALAKEMNLVEGQQANMVADNGQLKVGPLTKGFSRDRLIQQHKEGKLTPHPDLWVADLQSIAKDKPMEASNHWNYRVFEFVEEDGSVYQEIRTVYYTDDKPTSYAATPAVMGWNVIPGESALAAALREVSKFIAALAKPVLRESDFS